MKCILPLILLCLFSLNTEAQNNRLQGLKEKFLRMANEELLKNKISINDSILSSFKAILLDTSSIYESFDSIPGMKKLLSNNKKLAVYTWNVSSGVSHNYFGFIQFWDKEKNIYKVNELKNNTKEFHDIYKEKGTAKKWFGGLYYSLIERSFQNKTTYVLLGFDFNDYISSKKIIESLKIEKDGTPIFGLPLIKRGKSLVGRVVFEYSAKASMLLKYDAEDNMIIFDHLSSISPNYKGHPEFYAPDLSIDGLYFSDGLWHYKADLNLKSKRLQKSNKKPSGNKMFPGEFYKN